jgi:hypothetical protein
MITRNELRRSALGSSQNEKRFAPTASTAPKTRLSAGTAYAFWSNSQESWMDRSLLQYRPEIEVFESRETTVDRQAGLAAAEEMQLAAELLDRVDEGELEGYLVELIDRAGRTADRPVRSALASILAGTARRLVRRTGEPPNASAAGVFGLELEGLSPEDRAFEVARHFVRFASEAARRAGRAAGAGSPQARAIGAAASAARTLAPGLLPALPGDGKSTGAWVRRARQLIVLNP